jgi:hypothetical protein
MRGDYANGGKQREVPVPREARWRLTAYLEQRGPLGEDAIGRIVGKYATWAKRRG